MLRMTLKARAILAASLAVAACSTGDGDNGDAAPTAPATLSRTSTGWRINVAPFKVAAGTEVQRCVVVEGLPEDVLVDVSRVTQSNGGHHVALYTSPAARPGRVYDCSAASTMGSARFISPGPFDGKAENLAYKIRAGQPFIVQSHYVNATPSEVTVEDIFEADVLPAGATPRLVDFMALVDVDFLLPAGQQHTVTRTCNFQRDFTILRHFGHMHELGRHYTLERVPVTGPAEMLDTYAWEVEFRDNAPQNTFTVAQPLVLHAGEKLRLTCDWDNVTDHDVSFPEEMCVTFIHYLVDQGNPGGFLTCTDSAPELVE